MDMLTLVILVGAIVGGSSVALPVAYYKWRDGREERKKKREVKKMRKLEENPAYRAMEKKNQQIHNQLEKKGTILFQNVKDATDQKRVHVREETNFNLEKDILLKGKVRVKQPDNTFTEDTIYLFQPRVYGINGVQIGPKVDQLGHVYDTNRYLVRLEDGKAIYRGNVPRREVFSEIRFDYVKDAMNKEDELSSYIEIVLPKDEHGHFIPVDKQNKEEMALFRKYAMDREKYEIDQYDYLDNLLDMAEDTKDYFDELAKPDYAKPAYVIPESGVVERERKGPSSEDIRRRVTDYKMAQSIAETYGTTLGHGPHPGPGPRRKH